MWKNYFGYFLTCTLSQCCCETCLKIIAPKHGLTKTGRETIELFVTLSDINFFFGLLFIEYIGIIKWHTKMGLLVISK